MGIFSAIWDGITEFFGLILTQPLLNILVGLYELLPGENMLLAILVFTFITRIIIWPITSKSRQYQEEMRKVQPQIEHIREKYADDREKLYQETLKVYSSNGVNPAAGCLPIIVQLIISLGVFSVMRSGLDPEKIGEINDRLYPFLHKIDSFNTEYGWLNLTEPDPYFILPILVSGLQYLQTKLMLSRTPASQQLAGMQQTALFMPIFFFFIFITLPSGLTFYVALSSFFSIIEQQLFRPKLDDSKDKSGAPTASTSNSEQIIDGEIIPSNENAQETKPQNYLPKPKKKKNKKKKKT